MSIEWELRRFTSAYQSQSLTESIQALNGLGYSDEEAINFLNKLSKENANKNSANTNQ
jgi:Holliday junction resolvasome RuvABC DNA-binding subunit